MINRLAFILLLSASLTANPIGAADPNGVPTQIITFKPSRVETSNRQGRCWTSSIAAPRPDAWRCMEENEIFDPCFEAGDKRCVVCDPDPAKGYDGFALMLTEPLPKPDLNKEVVANAARSGWLVELTDGTRCQPATGARGVVESRMITFYCENPPEGQDIVLLDDLTSTHPQWAAEKATLSEGPSGPQILKKEKMAIKRVWQ